MVNACPWSTSKGIRGPVGKQNEMGEAEPGSRWEAGWDKLKGLPHPDYIIVDTAMWAAAGLNLNVPADSQVLLSSFKRVMLALDCSLTFVHHIGKDKKRGHLGAENLIAGIDVADCIDLEEKGIGYRKIKIINKPTFPR